MEQLTKVLKSLGAKHLTKHGLTLEKAHYELVGQALIDTLATALGDSFTKDTKEAWVAVYGVITDTMMEGSKEAGEAKSLP
mmetsp:Transcript_8921/g.24726  ORF Transcript_8921/g.24726 Transcript_8921/m.24726 type:complete len:81 (-) Transcript_8921:1198-1440(-)